MRLPHAFFFCLSFCTLLLPSTAAIADQPDDRCSWTDSGALDEQAVRAVRFDCTDGKLTWKYPSSAMIVRIWAPHDRTVWRFCIRPLIDHTPNVLLYRKDNNTLTPVSTTSERETCFEDGHRLTLFLQTETKPDYNGMVDRQPAGFFYSIVDAKGASTPLETDYTADTQCTPCSEQQLVDAFCSADLIFKGRLLRQVGTSLEFSVEKLIRKPVDSNGVLSKFRPKSTLTIATVRMNSCGPVLEVKNGASTEHLVIARTRLGRAELMCAPLVADFAVVVDRLRGRTPCELS
uniref:Meteorin-like protein n=1 Tax=Plectus sambesii TaxID=2011161 RepID=A0A914UVH4_9BILA